MSFLKSRRRSLVSSPIDFGPSALVVTHEMRPCPAGCGREHLGPIADPASPCFACWRAAHPYDGVPGVRIDAAGEDSADPRRVADGSAGFNVGLRGIDTDVGKRPNGKTALEYRPLSNREVSSNANRRELAKRQGLVPLEAGVYRSLR